MNRDRIEKLKEIVPADEAAEMVVLYNAYVDMFKAYQADPDKPEARLKAYRSAKAALVEVVESLENRYLTGVSQFRSVMEALRYLKDNKWKIEKSKLYKDRDAGLFRVNADKSVDEVEILAYAALNLEKIGATGMDDEAGKLSENKINAEIDLSNMRKEKLAFEIAKDKGQYIHRSKWLAELVSKLTAARYAAIRTVNNKAAEMIQAVGGDLKKQPILVELFTGYLEDAYNDLAAADELRFRVTGKAE